MKRENISNRELLISLTISLIVFISWNIYTKYFSSNKSYSILTDELKNRKIKIIELTVPILKNSFDIVKYSKNGLCKKYLEKDIEIVLNYRGKNFILNSRKVLYDLNSKDIIKVKISTQKQLKSCLFYIETLPTKSDVFLAIIFGYGAFMLSLFSLSILLYRYFYYQFKKEIS